MRKLILAATLAALSVSVATPALADPPPWAPAHGWRGHHEDGRDRGRDWRDQGRDWHDQGRDWHDGERRDWRRQDVYRRDRVMGRNDRIWYANGAYRCRRSDGTTGTLVGAALGGLLGSQLAGRGDRTLGTIIGLAGGAAIGRSIDRGQVVCR